MAASLTAYAHPANWFTNNNNNTVTISYSSGDVIVVIHGGDNAQQSPATAPTATNITFTQRALDNSGGFDECSIGIWTATATGSGTEIDINGTGGQYEGQACWNFGSSVTETGLSVFGPNTTESAFSSVSVGAGDAVCYVIFDWNAVTPGKTPLTGSGTATERFDDGDGSNYGIYVCDWINTSSGSFTFGTNNYTSLKVKHAGIVMPASAAAAGGIVTPTLSTAQRHLLTR